MTITLKELTFSNMFSYGENNKIDFNKNRITQLTAPNGSGKSSIALILQEVLFNKNIKLSLTACCGQGLSGPNCTLSRTI